MTLLRHRELGTFQTVPVPPEAKSLGRRSRADATRL